MKKLLYTTMALGLSYLSFGQQLTFNSQYMLNPYLINPAAAGTNERLNVATSFRQQWVGFNDAPRTQMLSFNMRAADNMGVGAVIYNDVTGPLRNIGFVGSYAYHLPINDESKLSFGLSLSMTQHVLDASQFVLNDEVDATLNNGNMKSLNPDASFGIQYFGEKFHIGIAAPQLIENKYKFGTSFEEINKQVRHYYLTGAYKFEINDDFEIEPSTLLKYVPSAPFQFDINARLIYSQAMWVGVSYRDKASLVAMVGMERGQFKIGYSYDYVVSNIRNYSGGTHELYLSFVLKDGSTKSSFGHGSIQ
ncbi:MAG: type IX secretion system membrane protein PorP/SprF [Flavobacteriales bacterium]|nr:type IX secretion system membrane protein PorP/SprF [Flavobacteriales bacterium]